MTVDIRDAIRKTIVDWVEPGSSVLELGCGRGDLLARLVAEKGVRAQGIEIDDDLIFPCIEKGLNVLSISRGPSTTTTPVRAGRWPRLSKASTQRSS